MLGLAIVLFLAAVTYLILEDKRSINKILLARASALNSAIAKQENRKDILEAEVLLLKNEVKFQSYREIEST